MQGRCDECGVRDTLLLVDGAFLCAECVDAPEFFEGLDEDSDDLFDAIEELFDEDDL